MYTKDFPLMKHQHDYTHGFTDLASCQAVCNDLWNGKDGCLAIDWHESDNNCVVYNGTSLTLAEWNATQYPLKSYFVCMLVPSDNDVQSADFLVRANTMV
eukprot:SAG11_NODE_19279_length_470_cov_0.938005_1_plen_99_part_10